MGNFFGVGSKRCVTLTMEWWKRGETRELEFEPYMDVTSPSVAVGKNLSDI